MPFRPVAPTAVRWRWLEAEGLEHCEWRPEGNRIMVRGAVIGARGGTPYGLFYRLALRPDWTVETAQLDTADGNQLRLASDGRGRWSDDIGKPLAAFDGCIDIDIAATPFTNTLPIRRLGLRPGDPPAALNMVYVGLPDLKPVIDRQIYSCLDGDRRYRYEAADRSFTAEISVDGDGLALHYQHLFERVPIELEP